jgi:dipeptidyl-peptidase-3
VCRRACTDLPACACRLLGHGTGRLLQEKEDGSLPFDPKKIINPLTGKPIESWYKFGELLLQDPTIRHSI